jgi:very-short-patch-repair endonuclease
MPVTSPARTLSDLAGVLHAEVHELAVAEAISRGLVHLDALREQLTRDGPRPGAKSLRSLLDRDEAPALTRSVAERKLLRLLRASPLPSPVTNARVGRYEVDFLWHKERLIVEVDGFAWHSSRHAFERDRERDAELQAAGYRVLRVTWRQLTREPNAVIQRIARALAADR